jgi:hypothetical protein
MYDATLPVEFVVLFAIAVFLFYGRFQGALAIAIKMILTIRRVD